MLVFTDGSFSRKPNAAGAGFVIVSSDGKQIMSNGCYSYKCENNNVAEILAIATALKYIHKKQINENKTLEIITDSDYARHRISNRFISNNKFENKLLTYIYDFIDNYPKPINIVLVKGHVHDGTKLSFYNNIADAIAGEYRHIALEKYKENSKFRHYKNKKDKYI